MNNKLTGILSRAAALLMILMLAVSMLAACGKEEPAAGEEKTEFKANSPIGIAETYVGKDVQDLIETVGTLKGDPVIEPANDGGGYQGTYEFDGFTAYTYAKSEDADAVVTEIVPDEGSDVYKESLKESGDSDSK